MASSVSNWKPGPLSRAIKAFVHSQGIGPKRAETLWHGTNALALKGGKTQVRQFHVGYHPKKGPFIRQSMVGIDFGPGILKSGLKASVPGTVGQKKGVYVMVDPMAALVGYGVGRAETIGDAPAIVGISRKAIRGLRSDPVKKEPGTRGAMHRTSYFLPKRIPQSSIKVAYHGKPLIKFMGKLQNYFNKLDMAGA